ncbi:MAG: hypothetical protein ACXADO_06615 [Candidatus Thorarchaeota archaeon]|jgi:formylmethanofuran dehydrogenase subunit B
MDEIVCTGCSLLCDDTVAEEKGGEVKSLGLCRLGHVYLESAAKHSEASAMISDSKSQTKVSMEEALEKAAEVLTSGGRCLLFGWSHSTDEAVKEGLGLAATLRAFFDTNASMGLAQALSHEIHSMQLDIDLEYVRNNGKFVIYWGSDPTESSHRHPSRFAVLPRGDKIPEGIESRTIGVVDVRETETMKMANHRIIIPPGADAELLNALTGEVSGTSSITRQVAGVPPTELLGLVRNLQKSDCTVLFYGSGIQNSNDAQENLAGLFGLVKAIRATGKEAYALPMAHDTNIMGAIKTSIEIAKSQSAVDYSSGSTNRSPNSTSLQKLVAGVFDVALIVGSDSLAEIPGPAARALASTSLVYIGPPGGLTPRKAAVSIFTNDEMVIGSGRMHRLDMVEIGLKSWSKITKGSMNQHDVLQRLHEMIQQKKG